MKILLTERLKELRKESGLTQKQFAEKFNLPAVTYLHYEKGHHEPPLSLLADIAVFYGVSVDDLSGLTDF